MILHSVDFGAELAARALPDHPGARAIARDHVIEDLGRAVVLEEWLERCDLRRLPRPRGLARAGGVEAIVEAERERQLLGSPAHVEAVLELLRLPLSFAPS